MAQPDADSTTPSAGPGAAPTDPRGPLFTVAIPVYNREDLVERTLESVYAQTFTDFEIVLVNDGSKDGSLEILRRHEGRESPPVRVIDQSNKGLAGARNTGAREARGRYVIFLDSDDLFLPWSLRTLADCVVHWKRERGDSGEPAMIAGRFRPFSSDDDLTALTHAPPTFLAFDDYLATRARRVGIAPSSTAVRTDLYNRVGGGEEVRVMFEDVEIWFKLGSFPGFVFAEGSPVAAYRVGHAQMMGNMQKQLDGFRWIARKVRRGDFPDGGARRREMEDALAVHAKSCAIRCLHAKDRPKGLEFYRRTLPWQIRNGEWRFLLAYPALWLAGRGTTSRSMRTQKKQTVSDE